MSTPRYKSKYPPRGVTCRNGHDLKVHGEWREATASRALHLRCMECYRAQRAKERKQEQAKRDARRAARAKADLPKDVCRNGHSRAKYAVKRGKYWRCGECDRRSRLARAEYLLALKRSKERL